MRYLLSLALLIILIASCSRRESVSSPAVFVDTTISVRLGESTAIPGTASSLRFDRLLYDGRLPSGHFDTNWWTNTAQVELSVLPKGEKLHLYISGEVPGTSGVHFDGSPANLGGFAYRMGELTPLPKELLVKIPDSELVARIEIDESHVSDPSDSGLFPLSLGNRWIYADTTFRGDTILGVSCDTITVADEYTDVFGRWRVLSHWFQPFEFEVMARADSVFSRQTVYGPLPPGAPLELPSLEFVSPLSDSSSFRVLSGGDWWALRSVTRLQSALITKAGSFENVWRYSVDFGTEKDTQLLAPGVGILYSEYGLYYSGLFSLTHHMWLIEYNVK